MQEIFLHFFIHHESEQIVPASQAFLLMSITFSINFDTTSSA